MTAPLRIAVLVKQVPLDTTGTSLRFGDDLRLARNELASEINPFCRRAIAQATELQKTFGGETVAFCVGPPEAEDSLREAVAAGIERAVLVSDPALSGADSLVTARVLAKAIADDGAFDLILCGLSSVDGFTGHIGPSVAQHLGLAFVSAVRELSIDGSTVTTDCERDDGFVGARVSMPAVLGVAERLIAPARALPDLRAAVSEDLIAQRSLGELGLDGSSLIVSATKVLAIRDHAPARAGTLLSGSIEDQLDAAVAFLVDRGAVGSSAPMREARVHPRGEGAPVVVVLEAGRDGLTHQLLAVAGSVAGALSATVIALSPSRSAETSPERLGGAGADEVIYLSRPDGAELGPVAMSEALNETVKARAPHVVIAPATSFGREVASRFCAQRGLGLLADAVAVAPSDEGLVVTRRAFGGRVEVDVSSSSEIECLTLRSGATAVPEPRSTVAIESELAVVLAEPVEYFNRRRDDEIDELMEASALVGIGAGVAVERYGELEALLSVLRAKLVGTRRVADEGWLPRGRQIGLTGQYVLPRLYLAIGLSGKLNHVVGLQRAGTIVAVNSDPEAPIFKGADIGIVAPWEDVIVGLTDRLAKALASIP